MSAAAVHSTVCNTCTTSTTIPCREHAQAVAMSVALKSLREVRHGRGFPEYSRLSKGA